MRTKSGRNPCRAAVWALAFALLPLSGCATTSSEESTESKAEESESKQSDSSEEATGTSIGDAVDRTVDGWGGESAYRVLFAQDGQYRAVEENRLELQPAAFEVHVVMEPDAAVMINVSRSPTSRDRVVNGGDLEKGVGHPATGMAEEMRNANRDLKLDERGSNYWFYKDDSKHRFDEVEQRGDLIVGKRTVEHLFKEGDRSPVEKAAGSEIYVVECEHRGGSRQKRPPKRAYTIAFAEDDSD